MSTRQQERDRRRIVEISLDERTVVRRSPDLASVLPGYPWAPAIFVLFTLLFATLAATVNPWEMLAALVTICSGVLLYRVLHGRWTSMQ